MSYLKPQTPLQHKDGDYFYPLTTIDQVIMEDGITRLNGADLVSVNTDGAPEGEIVKVNADTLGGYSADNFIKNTEEINADTLGGISADEFAKLSDLENVSAGMTMELLWENASPSSEFAAQTIPLDLSEYKILRINCSSIGYCEQNVGKSLDICVFMCPEGETLFATRRCKTTITGVTFSECREAWDNIINSFTVNNGLLRPYAIYGIK